MRPHVPTPPGWPGGALGSGRASFEGVDELGRFLADAEPEVEKQLLVDGVNILIGSVEVLRTKFLEKPLQSSSPTPAFDAWRSGESVASMQASFDALRVGLLGRDVVPGLVAVLQGRGLLTLAEGLERLVGASARAFSTCRPTWVPQMGASAAKAATELAKLQYFLAEDVATKLKVAGGIRGKRWGLISLRVGASCSLHCLRG